MSENLQAAVQRVLAGNRDEGDLWTIAAAIQARQVVLVPGSTAVGIDGNVENSPIVLGHSNVVGDNNLVIYGAEAEEIQALLAQRLNQQARSLDELVLQVRKRCYDKVLKLYSKIQLLNRQQIDIGRLYVDVYVLEKLPSISHATISGLLKGKDLRESFDRLGLGKREKRSPGLEVATEHSRLMVFGKPGSGKSTFLRHLAVACAKGDFSDGFIPILFELRFIKDADQFNLWEFLRREFRLANQAQVEQVLQQARVLLLLDGLDEVPAQSLQAVQNHILDFAQQCYEHHFILSCRTQTTEYILPTFEPIEVADFNPEQVKAFAENWFSLLAETCEEGEALKQRFLKSLSDNQAMAELAVTPILLSLTCWVFGDLKNLPLKRSDLYEQGICLLLRQWDEQRGVRRDGVSEIYRKLSLKERRQLLSYVAVRKFEQAENFVLYEESELCGYIAEYLQISVEESQAVLQAIAQQHGLLIERAQGIWSFSHLTFQEYLVAKWFCDQQSWETLAEKIKLSYWREVFVIASELCSNIDELLMFMKKHADKILEDGEDLQLFLNRVYEKSESLKTPYHSAKIRALYFNINRNNILNLDLDSEKSVNQNFDLDFKSVLNENYAPDCVFDYELSLLLYEAYWLSAISRDTDYSFGKRSLMNRLSEVLRWEILDRSLINKIQEIQKKMPDSSSENWGAFKKWWREEGRFWADQLRELLVKYRDIRYNLKSFQDEQWNLLEQYYAANQILVNCLNSDCAVNTKVKQEIEETLLLPIAEIEKRKKQSSD